MIPWDSNPGQHGMVLSPSSAQLELAPGPAVVWACPRPQRATTAAAKLTAAARALLRRGLPGRPRLGTVEIPRLEAPVGFGKRAPAKCPRGDMSTTLPGIWVEGRDDSWNHIFYLT